MNIKTKITLAVGIFFIYLYWSGNYFLGSEESARKNAIIMFNSYIDERQLPRELFEGPGKPKKNSEGYLFYWTLKPFDKNYPPLQLIAGVSGGFNSDMIITTETLMFFKNECERDRAAGKRELSPFKGFCD